MLETIKNEETRKRAVDAFCSKFGYSNLSVPPIAGEIPTKEEFAESIISDFISKNTAEEFVRKTILEYESDKVKKDKLEEEIIL